MITNTETRTAFQHAVITLRYSGDFRNNLMDEGDCRCLIDTVIESYDLIGVQRKVATNMLLDYLTK